MMRDPGKQRGRWFAIIALTVAIVGLAVNAYMIRTQQFNGAKEDTSTAVQGQKQVADEGQALADEVLTACSAGGKQAKALSAAGLCGKAATAKDNIDDTVKDTPAVPSSSSTTIVRRETLPQGTLIAAIQSVLSDRLAATCGTDGCRDGKDSTVPGPVGPSSTVAGPEGQPGPQGPKGDTGDRGADGKDSTVPGPAGRGITSLACSGALTPITFTITFDDGTAQTVTCGGTTPADPDPQPTE